MGTETEVTETDFSIAFNGILLQAKAFNLDTNDDDIRLFLIHQAELNAQNAAERRNLYNIIHVL